jgi:pimeloyl-ACP methyl ester carboxylesterase
MVPERLNKVVLAAPVGVKTGSRDRLDVPDIFAMPKDRENKLMFHDPAKGRVDASTLSDDQLAATVRNRETLALLAWEPYMHNPKLRHRLHRLHAPTLLLRGASDGFVSAEYLAAYAKLLPDARIETVADAGHALAIDAPAAFAQKVLAFLEA